MLHKTSFRGNSSNQLKMYIVVYLPEYSGFTDVNVSFKLVKDVSHGGEGVNPY